jgi:acetoacetyl-CoA synthetase
MLHPCLVVQISAGCFVASIPTLPVYRGELQGPCLGMATAVFDSQGKVATQNEKGELVCTVPFPSKPIGFWGDEENEKYLSAYFEGFQVFGLMETSHP